MNMRHSGGIGAATQQAPRPDAPWEKTPWWNYHRWFGLDLRRWVDNTGRPDLVSPWWHYGNSKKVARNVLSSMYDEPKTRDTGIKSRRARR
jgi:hypothetical protein